MFLFVSVAHLIPLNQAWSSSQELPKDPLIHYSQVKVKVTNCQPITQVLEMLIANHNNELLLKTAEVVFFITLCCKRISVVIYHIQQH